jgi:hypothetical protein
MNPTDKKQLKDQIILMLNELIDSIDEENDIDFINVDIKITINGVEYSLVSGLTHNE